MLLYKDSTTQPEIPDNLPSLGSVVGPASQCCPPLSKTQTVTHFVLAMLRLLVQVGRLHKGLVAKVSNILFRMSLSFLPAQNMDEI